MKDLKSFAAHFWIPIVLFILAIIALFKLVPVSNQDSYNTILGVSLGVLLGFLADITKRSFDKFQETRGLKKTAFTLLQQDAERVFRSVEMFKGAIVAPGAPAGVANTIPPKFELKYWDRLSKRDDFLILGTEEPLKSIFSEFWEMEKLNNLIDDAHNAPDETRRRNAAMLAVAIGRTIREENHHEQWLGKFMTPEQIEDVRSSLRAPRN